VSWPSKRLPVANGVAEASWLQQLLAELHSPLSERAGLLQQRQCGVSLHQPGPTPEDQACGDRSTLRPGSGRRRRCSGPTCPDHHPVRRHLHQGSPVLDLDRVPLQPQHH